VEIKTNSPPIRLKPAAIFIWSAGGTSRAWPTQVIADTAGRTYIVKTGYNYVYYILLYSAHVLIYYYYLYTLYDVCHSNYYRHHFWPRNPGRIPFPVFRNRRWLQNIYLYNADTIKKKYLYKIRIYCTYVGIYIRRNIIYERWTSYAY